MNRVLTSKRKRKIPVLTPLYTATSQQKSVFNHGSPHGSKKTLVISNGKTIKNNPCGFIFPGTFPLSYYCLHVI